MEHTFTYIQSYSTEITVRCKVEYNTETKKRAVSTTYHLRGDPVEYASAENALMTILTHMRDFASEVNR